MPTLIEAQKRQREHDREFHQDIYTLPYPDRINHYTLHFTKYVGRLSHEYTDEEQLESQLEKTLADSFIVSIAAANTLSLDIEENLSDMFGLEAVDIEDWCNQLNQSGETMSSKEIQEWWFEHMAAPAGHMANALESLDHMESVNVRDILEENTVEIISILLIVADMSQMDLMEVAEDRWKVIEENSVL